MPGVGPVGLGMPLAAAGEGGVGRLGHMRRDPGRGQLRSDIPPPGAPFHRERDVVPAGEPRQPGPQVLPVGRGDLAAPDLPGHGVEIVEGDLLPVDVEPAYDGHRDLLKLPERASAPARECLRVNRDVSELGGLPRGHQPGSSVANDPSGPMHVIFWSGARGGGPAPARPSGGARARRTSSRPDRRARRAQRGVGGQLPLGPGEDLLLSACWGPRGPAGPAPALPARRTPRAAAVGVAGRPVVAERCGGLGDRGSVPP